MAYRCCGKTIPQSKIRRFLTAPFTQGSLVAKLPGGEKKGKNVLYSKQIWRNQQHILSLSRLRRQLPHQREPWILHIETISKNPTYESIGRVCCFVIARQMLFFVCCIKKNTSMVGARGVHSRVGDQFPTGVNERKRDDVGIVPYEEGDDLHICVMVIYPAAGFDVRWVGGVHSKQAVKAAHMLLEIPVGIIAAFSGI